VRELQQVVREQEEMLKRKQVEIEKLTKFLGGDV
jgi:hypothetical protein